jgi:next-to-BRCA1 protein 1
LNISADTEAVFERYSDSATAYVVLDKGNTAVYKQLYRAAKAKQKLKLRITVKPREAEEKNAPKPASVEDETEEDAARPSVEPTDVEQEVEEPVISDSAPTTPEEKTSAQPAPEILTPPVDVYNLRSMKEMLDECLTDPVPTTQSARSETTHHTAPACAMVCPAAFRNYAICCNSCDRAIPDLHYHCDNCDSGDFDLCTECFDRGIRCKGANINHWLIKRFVRNGVIIRSTTERLKSKPKTATATAPNAPERIIPVFNDFLYSTIRTCNCCVQELPEVEFVHCTTCEDYDLCRACFAKNRHGHHPRHAFVPAVEGTRLEPEIARRLLAGRGQAHTAICDGCDKGITGIRHKCQDCPDWDYCSGCVVNASFIHPGHRFVPIYEPLEYDGTARLRAMNRPVHYGICCDGPLCSGARTSSTYIIGDRFKCAVCNDTDFCESCEASPANTHNRTHPLIKFKTPVRHVSVTTTGENENGRQMPTMGDRPRPRPTPANPRAAEASRSPVLFSNVQTVVDVKPSEPEVPIKVEEKKEEVQVKEEIEEKPVAVVNAPPAADLVATFVRDTVSDGTAFPPDFVFEQTWALRNTGTTAWPAGCSVKFVGGDYMGHLDSTHPAATRDVEFSCESTICYASIQPGEEFPFTVLLRTPRRSGRFVSNWRLTTKDGNKFGHRLWCDVVVEKPKVVLPPPAVTEPVEQKEEKKNLVETEPEAGVEHSQMIFPKLEKESPVASFHEDAKTESVSAHDEEYEDCEEDDWDRAASDEGFLTDEEYDVLDASDEEFFLDARAKKA